MADPLWPILSVAVAALYMAILTVLLVGFVFNIINSSITSVDGIISKVTVYITCGGSIAIILLHLLYLVGSAIVAWIPSAADYYYYYNNNNFLVFIGDTFIELAFVLLAIYHTACVVQKAKDSDLDRGQLCLGAQLLLILLAAFTLVVGAFPTVILGIINFAVAAGPAWYQWLWMAVFLIDIVAIALISTVFYVSAIQSDVQQTQATSLLYLMCLLFVIFNTMTLVLNLTDTVLAYFTIEGAAEVMAFVVLTTNGLWSVTLLFSFFVVFLPWVNRGEGLSGV